MHHRNAIHGIVFGLILEVTFVVAICLALSAYHFVRPILRLPVIDTLHAAVLAFICGFLTCAVPVWIAVRKGDSR
jgi:hypothetical protein